MNHCIIIEFSKVKVIIVTYNAWEEWKFLSLSIYREILKNPDIKFQN
jgi:hypothetical protein